MPRLHPGSGNRVNHSKPAFKKYKQKSPTQSRKHISFKHSSARRQDVYNEAWEMKRGKLENALKSKHNGATNRFLYIPLAIASIISGYTEEVHSRHTPFVNLVQLSIGAHILDEVHQPNCYSLLDGHEWTDQTWTVSAISVEHLLVIKIGA